MLFDATCPLVTKVHMEVARASRKGKEAILIGHAKRSKVRWGNIATLKVGCILLKAQKMFGN